MEFRRVRRGAGEPGVDRWNTTVCERMHLCYLLIGWRYTVFAYGMALNWVLALLQEGCAEVSGAVSREGAGWADQSQPVTFS